MEIVYQLRDDLSAVDFSLIAAESDRGNYLAIGFSENGAMVPSDAIICYGSNTLERFALTSYQTPIGGVALTANGDACDVDAGTATFSVSVIGNGNGQRDLSLTFVKTIST